MASSKVKNKTIPRLDKKQSIQCIESSIIDIPLPVKNEFTEQVKRDIASLKDGKCLVFAVGNEKTLREWQQCISSICSNYSRKLGDTVKYTVRVIDKSIGVWRIK